MSDEALTIRDVRTALGLTQVQLGQLIGGTHFVTISRWERGYGSPTSFQWGLLQAFSVAATRPGTVDLLKAELATHGPIVALASLLRAGITSPRKSKP